MPYTVKLKDGTVVNGFDSLQSAKWALNMAGDPLGAVIIKE